MSQQSTDTSSGVGAMDSGLLTAIGGIALIVNVVGLYAFTGVALCVFAYIVLTLILSSRAGHSTTNPGSAEAGTTVLILSWVAALVGGALVGGLHWIPYATAAYAVLGLYAIAVLIWVFGRAYGAFWSWMFPIAGIVLLAAVMQLGSPPGADDMDKKENWTPVTVTALDQDGQPIEGATVILDLLPFWKGDPAWEDDREWWGQDTTRADGTVRMMLPEDPRFKRLLIRVRHEPFTGGINEPTTIGGYVGHEDVRRQAMLPAPKVPYSFRVEMTRRAHPDKALLAIELVTPASSNEPAARSIKLALTAEPELPWDENGRTFDESAVVGNGCVRDLSLSGSQKVVFRLGRDLADRPLTFHILERDSTRHDESFLELSRIDVDSIRSGEERMLPTIELPNGNSAATIGDGGKAPDLR